MAPLTRALLLSLLVAGLAALGLVPAAAAPGDGMVRMMHLSPDTPSVDAYVDSGSTPGTEVVLPAVGYGDVSPYQSVPAGTYTVSARNAGADPAGAPALAATVTVEPGRAITIAVVGAFADLGFAVLQDDLTLPPAGQARARVINAAATASPLDVSLAGSTSLARGLEFARETGYVDVPGGPGTLTATAPGVSADLPVDLSAGSVSTVLVLDRTGGGIAVEATLDAAGPGVVPTGGVATGAGGTAGGTGTGAVVWTAVATAAAVALLVTALLRPGRARAPRHAAS